jgi:hypothetical protein
MVSLRSEDEDEYEDDCFTHWVKEVNLDIVL